MKRRTELPQSWLVAASITPFVACGPTSEADRLDHWGPIDGPFAVSEYFAPSGHMGDGETPGHIVVDVANDNCANRPPGARGDCYRFTYTPGNLLWAGVYWQYPANNWGTRPGRSTLPIFKSVKFYAATDTDGLSVQFITGGIQNPAFPYADQFRDGIFEKVGFDWKPFTIDVSFETTYDAVIGAFAWVTSYPTGTDPTGAPPTVLYLDDIVWE